MSAARRAIDPVDADRPDDRLASRQADRPADRNADRPDVRPGRRQLLLAGVAGLGGLALAGCTANGNTGSAQSNPSSTGGAGATTTPGTGSPTRGGTPTAGGQAAARPSAVVMHGRASVPVLCYHQVRPYAGDDTAYVRSMLVIPPEKFAAQLAGIKAAGYTAISPQQYRDHLFAGAALPAKPVVLSFDDGKDNQFQQAMPALRKHGMTGVFFIMTVVLGQRGWMTKDDVKKLVDAGMSVGSHTWDHHMVTKYSGTDYTTQLVASRELLSGLSGQDVVDFAYPYGAWNTAILPHLTAAGYRTAYQLMDKPLDVKRPELSLRRILAVSTWTGPEVVAKLDAFARDAPSRS